jgi:hypothetical protein
VLVAAWALVSFRHNNIQDAVSVIVLVGSLSAIGVPAVLFNRGLAVRAPHLPGQTTCVRDVKKLNRLIMFLEGLNSESCISFHFFFFTVVFLFLQNDDGSSSSIFTVVFLFRVD